MKHEVDLGLQCAAGAQGPGAGCAGAGAGAGAGVEAGAGAGQRSERRGFFSELLSIHSFDVFFLIFQAFHSFRGRLV